MVRAARELPQRRCGLAERNRLSLRIQHQHTVGECGDLIQPMLDQQRRGALPAGLVERGDRVGRGLAVEMRYRLVDHQRARLLGQRRGERKSLAPATGERKRALAPTEPERGRAGDRALDAAVDLARRKAAVLEREGDLVLDRERDELRVGVLQDRGGDAGAGRELAVAKACPADVTAALGPDKGRDGAEKGQGERGLAAAGRADQRQSLAGTERQRDVLDRIPDRTRKADSDPVGDEDDVGIRWRRACLRRS